MGAVDSLHTESLTHFLKCHQKFLLEIRRMWGGGCRRHTRHPAYKQGIFTNLGMLGGG